MQLFLDNIKDTSIFEGADSIIFDVSMHGGYPQFDDNYNVVLMVEFMDG